MDALDQAIRNAEINVESLYPWAKSGKADFHVRAELRADDQG